MVADAEKLLKWCSYGKHFVPATDEYFNRKKTTGLYPYCKECCHEIYVSKAQDLKLKRLAKQGRR